MPENDNPPPDPRQLPLFPGFKPRPELAKCRPLTDEEEAERLEWINAAPRWTVEHE